MAIALDQALGSNTANFTGSGGSFTITTGATTAAACRIVVIVSYFDSLNKGVTVSDSGGSYTADKTFANGSDHLDIFSRVTSSALASGSTITITLGSTPGGGGYLAGACSYTGTTGVDTTGTNTGTTAAAWTTGNVTCALADSLYVAGAGTDGSITSESSTPGTGNERFDLFLASDNQGAVMQDLIVSSAGAHALTGTWANTTGLTTQTMVVVVYKGAAAGVGPQSQVLHQQHGPLRMGPYMRGPQGQYGAVGASSSISIWVPANLRSVRRLTARAPSRNPTAVPPQVPIPPTVPGNKQPANARKLFALQPRGHEPQPVPAQVPVPPTVPGNRMAPIRRMAALVRGHRAIPGSPQEQARPPQVNSGRSKIAAQRRGKLVAPIPPQVPVPAWPIRVLRFAPRPALLRRGRATNPVLSQTAAPQTGPLVASPRNPIRRLVPAGRGRQVAPVPPQQQPPVVPFVPAPRTAPRRLVARIRGRQTFAPPGQAAPPPVARTRPKAVTPVRSRRPVPTPAQIPVPKWVPKWLRSLPRPALLRRGRKAEPAWPQVLLPPAGVHVSLTDARTTLSFLADQRITTVTLADARATQAMLADVRTTTATLTDARSTEVLLSDAV